MPKPNAPLPPSKPFLLEPLTPNETAEKAKFKAFFKPFLLAPFTYDDAELAYQAAVSRTQVSKTQIPEAQVPEELLQKLALEQQEQSILSRVGRDLKTFVRHGEMFTAPVHGFIKGWNEMIDSTDALMNWLSEKRGLPLNPALQLFDQEGNFDLKLLSKRPEGVPPLHIPNVSPPESGTGHLASGISQFMAGFGPIFKGLKSLNSSFNVLKGASGTSALGTGALGTSATGTAVTAGVAGALTDFIAFDPYEERLSNLAAEYGPEPIKAVFEFLKADKEDSEGVARFKNVIEGVVVGGAVGGIVKLAQTMKRFLSHPKRIEGLTGQHYQADPTVLQAAQELKYWADHLNEEAALYGEVSQHLKQWHEGIAKEVKKTQGITPQVLSEQAKLFAQEIRKVIDANKDAFTPRELAENAFLKSAHQWKKMLASSLWEELPEAAKQDFESILFQNPLLYKRLPEDVRLAFEADRTLRQQKIEAQVDQTLHFKTFKFNEGEPAVVSLKNEAGDPLLHVTHSQLQEFLHAMKEGDTQVASSIIGRGINFSAIHTDADTLRVMKALEKLTATEINAATGNVRGWSETEQIAELLGKSPATVQHSLSQLFNTTKLMDGQVRAANLYLQSLFSTLKREAVKLDQGFLNEEGVANFVRLKRLTQETLVMVQGVTSNMARAMNSLKMPVHGKAFAPDQIAKILDSEGGLKSLRKLVTPQVGGLGSSGILDSVKEVAPLFTLRG